MSDPINKPPHYTFSPVEPINAIEAWGLNYRLGNVIKYVARADHKGKRLEDLRKAAWYLAREIEREEASRAPARPAVTAVAGAPVLPEASVFVQEIPTMSRVRITSEGRGSGDLGTVEAFDNANNFYRVGTDKGKVYWHPPSALEVTQ